MPTDKKNQHYIPKFYLRNFSFNGNKKQIGLFNINNSFFHETAKLKTQGSKNFYYGVDGIIEDGLAEIEGIISKTLKKIIEDKQVPKKDSQDYFNLLMFIVLTDLRNPVRIEGSKKMFQEMRDNILSIAPDSDVDSLVPRMSHDEHIKMCLSQTPHLMEVIYDLDYKLIINETDIPFITSDFPILKYNRFLEEKKWVGTKAAFGNIGLKIFIVINHQISLVFFDSAIYKVGNKRDKMVRLDNNEDINQLNLLQITNCLDTVYFDEKVKKEYILNIFEKSKQFTKANLTTSQLSYIVREGEEISDKQNLMILGSTDSEIKLNISVIKIHSKGKSTKLNVSMSQLRKHPEMLRRKKNDYR